MYKEVRTSEFFPEPERVAFDEMATLLEFSTKLEKPIQERFRPNDTQKYHHDKYFESTSSALQIELLYGGVRSGKTVSAICLFVKLMVKFPGTRGIGVRLTYDELKDSLIPSWIDFLNAMGYEEEEHYTQRLDPPGIYFKNGSQIIFRSEKSAKKTKEGKADALGGTAYDFAHLEEADELSENFFLTIIGRLSQGALPHPLICITVNPPSEDHWLHRIFFVETPKGGNANYEAIHFPVEGNAQNLREGYVQELEDNLAKHPTLYKKYRLGQFGPAIKGRPIFGKIFKRHLHVIPEGIEAIRGLPLQRSIDFGYRRPAFVIAQWDPSMGQMRALYARMGHNMLLEQFLKKELPIHKQLFPGFKFEDYCDVEGKKRNPYSDKTQIQICQAHNMDVQCQYTEIAYGLNIMRDALATLCDNGEPALVFDGQLCHWLIEGFEFGYTQDEDAKEGALKPVDSDYTHCMDALRYIIIHKLEMMSQKIRKPKERKAYIPMQTGGVYQTFTQKELRELDKGKPDRIAGYGFGKRRR
jgi:PBSX family phage terminase large subunit